MHKLCCCIAVLLCLFPAYSYGGDCGAQLGTAIYNGIATYDNGQCMGGSCQCGSDGSHGGHWYCVEYARRYYCDAQHIPDVYNWNGHAGTWFSHAGQRGLVAYWNDYTTEAPKADDILCYSGGGYGHVAIVTGVTDNGNGSYTVRTIEQNWSPTGYVDLPLVKTSTQAGMGHYHMVPREGYTIQGWLRFPWDLIEQEYNDNGGYSAFGTRYLEFTDNEWGTNKVHFYHGIYGVGGYYSDNGTSGHEDCVIHNFSSGSYGACGIVFDAFGGARRCYTVRTGFWDDGNNHGWAHLSGPRSSFGMPITNEYNTGYGARQDFTKGYLKYISGTGVTDPQGYPHAAPGWHENNNWDEGFSYLFAMAYERNGAWSALGDATEPVDLNWRGTAYHVQHFGSGDRMIVYDPYNSVDNDYATNEAYYICGNFYEKYTALDGPGPWLLGAPTRDREGNVQYFKYGRMEELSGGVVHAYDRNGTCIWGCQVGAVGGPAPFSGIAFDFDGDSIADYWDRTSTGEFHLDYAANNLSEWDTTFYGYGGSQDNPAPADYDGDGKYDFAVLKNSNSKWYIDYAWNGFGAWDDSLGGYGTADDYPCPGDFDGDGIADISVRDADGDWHIDYFAQGTGFGAWDTTFYGYGGQYDRPAPADYDGDGKCDFAILRNSDHKYLIDYADNGFGSWDETGLGGYGGYADYPCPADYDNDGKDDIAVLNTGDRVLRVDRTGNGFNGWDYVLGGYGGSGDRPMPADYDGDGWDDIATFYAAYDQICLDYASNNYGSWDWCDDGPDHPTWKLRAVTTIPYEFDVVQNYPNPFNAGTIISYSLAEAGPVKIDIYNILGQKIETLVDEIQASGPHSVAWEAKKQSSGMYFYRITAGGNSDTKKMVLMK